MTKEITLEQIKKYVKRLDPNQNEKEDGFKAAVVLLASASLGPNITKIQKFTRYSMPLLKKFDKNLRKNKVWHKDKIFANWFDKKTGTISFWMDCSVALGYVRTIKARPSHEAKV